MRARIVGFCVGIVVLPLALVAGPHGAAAAPAAAPRAAATANVDYRVTVQTGNVTGAGTDANVYVRLVGARATSRAIELDSEIDNFERNTYNVFTLTLPDLGTINRICMWRNDAGLGDEWNLTAVSVNAGFAPRTAYFRGWMPAFTWICRPAS
jgi:hypothetical protein